MANIWALGPTDCSWYSEVAICGSLEVRSATNRTVWSASRMSANKHRMKKELSIPDGVARHLLHQRFATTLWGTPRGWSTVLDQFMILALSKGSPCSEGTEHRSLTARLSPF
eukprot:3970248-Amphidinium_carterae.1